MRKLFILLAFAMLPVGAARAQFCPGAAPYVFNDVAASHAFCTYVTWMAQAGITNGCIVIDANNRLYCPDDFVTRMQMSAFISRLANVLAPSTCAAGQVMKWNGAAWACSDDNVGGGGGGGTVTSVAAGTGLAASPSSPITGAGTLNVALGYQLPQGCASGQVPKSNGLGGWTCQDDIDTNSGGTVTSVTAGTGLAATPSPITGAGTLGLAAGYQLPQGCASGQVAKSNGTGGWTCQADDAGPANAFVQGGNAFAATAVLGTTDDNAVDVRANNARVMRFEPNAISPNVIGGSPANNVMAGVRGATIAGGGVPDGNTDPDFSGDGPNLVTDAYGTVGGGFRNQAGNGDVSATNMPFATVGGGTLNLASGTWSVIGGGALNIASGVGSTVSGGSQNTSMGNYSWAGGRQAKTHTPGASPSPHDGAFAWADSNNFDFHTTAGNEFAARATGGVRFVTAIDGTGAPTRTVRINANGELEFGGNLRQNINLWSNQYGIGVQAVTLYFRTEQGYSWHMGGTHSDTANDPGAGGTELMRLQSNGNLLLLGTVGSLSDRAAKRDFAPVDAAEVLEKVVRLPLTEWSYERSPEARHVGPTAQDFRAAFGLGDSERSIATVDADGVALAAIQGLNAKLEARVAEQEAALAARDAEIAQLKAGLIELRRAVERLNARAGGDERVAAR